MTQISESSIEPAANGETSGEQEYTINISLLPSESGIRLDMILHRRYPAYSRNSWQERIRDGNVFVNEEVVRPSRKCREGDTVTFSFTKKQEADVNSDYGILLEDDHVLVIDKPSNLPVHPSGNYYKNTLLYLLKEKYGPDFVAHFVHRLDRETSGVLLMAKTPADSAFLQKTFLDHRVRKEYLVAVEGIFDSYIDACGYITYDKESIIRRKRRFHLSSDIYNSGKAPDDGETSRTELFPEKINRSEKISLIRARIHTGRTHQIRATLFSLGYPIIGDRIYGIDENLYISLLEDGDEDNDISRLRLRHTALHSTLLEFPHPDGGTRIIESPLPDQIKNLFENS